MSEELQKALEDFLAKVINGIETAGEFAVEQIPDVIQQALTWYMVSSLLATLVGALFIGGAVWLAHRTFNKKNGWVHRYREDGMLLYVYDNEPLTVAGGMLYPTMVIVGLVTITSNTEWLMILVAPKWFIVTEMAKLI